MNALKRALARRGIPLAVIARESGVSRATVSKLANAKSPCPSKDVGDRIAAAIGLDPAVLWRSNSERGRKLRAFGTPFDRAVRRSGLTIGEIARQAGLHPTTIYGIRRGRRRHISYYAANSLAEVLGVTRAKVLSWVHHCGGRAGQ